MATKKTSDVIEIRPLDIKKINLRIVGDSPLIIHNWSEKAKKQMLDNAMGISKGKKKDPKDPVYEVINSLYWIEGKPEEDTMEAFYASLENGARFGIKAVSIKAAAISAAYRKGWSKNKVGLQGEFFIESDENGLLEIKGSNPVMREDPVTVGIGGTDLRYRGEFQDWHVDFTMRYDANGTVTLENIINMINAGGFFCGIGEWRVEKGGMNGMFHVEGI